MMSFITRSLKVTAIAAGLFTIAAPLQAAVYETGQQVTEFIVNEDAGLITAPQFSTDETLNNWAYGSYQDGNVIANTDQRGWRAVFEVNAPVAGKYGVEVKLRTTTTNWMVAFNATAGLGIDERANLEVAPAWANMVRPTKISTISKTTNVIQEADTVNGIPAVTEDVFSFASGEWETIYVPVDLLEGHNYVTFWLCRTYSGIDALKGPEGSVNGMYVQSLKVMPQGSGEVADVLQKATLKLWQQRLYSAMNSEEGANLKADYDKLLAAYAVATDYSGLATADVQKGIEAVAAREQDLRHGKGAIVSGDSAVFALPYYHALHGGAISENERGEYSDAPMVFEYTNGKTLVYKFTAAVTGEFYPELYEGSQLSVNAHLVVLAEDSVTVVMPEWVMPANSGNWQTYIMNSNPALAKFSVEAGKTYYLTIYFENYVNVRGLYMRQILKKPHTYAELQELSAKGEDLFAQYAVGSDNFNAIGGRTDLISALEEALAVVSELDESSSSAEVTAAYYELDDAIAQIENAPKLNVIPNTESNVFNISNGQFTKWRTESNGANIGYAYADGSVVYTTYCTKDCKYDLTFTCSAPGQGAQVAVYVDFLAENGDTVRIFDRIVDIAQSGGWANWDMETANYKVEGVAVPVGRFLFTVFGYKAADNNFVGNFNMFNFAAVEGTEGAGAVALAADIKPVVNKMEVEDIYTLDGIYVGNNSNLLRNGIYIINGKKVVIK